MVDINTGPITPGLSPDEVSKEKWNSLVLSWRQFIKTNFPYDCRELSRFINQADQYGMWDALGYSSLEEFIYVALKLDPEEVNWAMEGLELFDVDKPVALKQAVDKGKQREEWKARHEAGEPYRSIAQDAGVSPQTVINRLSNNPGMPEKLDTKRKRITYQIQSGTQPQTAAQKIRDKFGREFALSLAGYLLEE